MIKFFVPYDLVNRQADTTWEFKDNWELDKCYYEDGACPSDDSEIKAVYIDGIQICLTRLLGKQATFKDLLILLGIV